jgi:hypothetical protein
MVMRYTPSDDAMLTYHLCFLLLLQFLMQLSQRWCPLVMGIRRREDGASAVAGWADCTECMSDGTAMLGGGLVGLHLIQV